MIRGTVLTILAALLGVTAACSLGVAAYIIIQPGASPESGVAENEVMEASETDVEPTEKDSTISVEAELAPIVVNDNDSGYDMTDNDASASSIMDATNNPGGIVQTDDDTYADDAAKDRENEGSNDGTNNDANRNTDGTYSWQVNGVTITTRINVMDYIDGNVWHVNDMATALGWDKNKRANSPQPMTFQPDDTYDIYINFSDASDHCGAIIIEGNNKKPISIVLPSRAADDYTFNDQDYTMPFEGIVIFAYTCERLTVDPSCDPYYGVFNGSSGDYRLLN